MVGGVVFGSVDGWFRWDSISQSVLQREIETVTVGDSGYRLASKVN